MSTGGDEWDEMNETRRDGAGQLPDPVIDEVLGAADPGSPALAQFLSDLRALGTGPAPQPSAELDAYLGRPASELDVRRHRRHRRAAVVAAAAACTVTLTGVAAAADVLPGPAQRMVSRVVNDTTGLHLGGDSSSDRTPHPGGSVGILPATATDDRPPTSPGAPGTGEDTGGGATGTPDETPAPGGGAGEPGGSNSPEPGDGYPAAGSTPAPTRSGPEPGDGTDASRSASTSYSGTRTPSPSPTGTRETETGDH